MLSSMALYTIEYEFLLLATTRLPITPSITGHDILVSSTRIVLQPCVTYYPVVILASLFPSSLFLTGILGFHFSQVAGKHLTSIAVARRRWVQK